MMNYNLLGVAQEILGRFCVKLQYGIVLGKRIFPSSLLNLVIANSARKQPHDAIPHSTNPVSHGRP